MTIEVTGEFAASFFNDLMNYATVPLWLQDLVNNQATHWKPKNVTVCIGSKAADLIRDNQINAGLAKQFINRLFRLEPACLIIPNGELKVLANTRTGYLCIEVPDRPIK